MSIPPGIPDDLPIGVWVGRAPDGVGVYANDEFRRILGIPLDPGSTIRDAIATYAIHDRQGRHYPVERLPFSRVLATEAPADVDDLVIHSPDGRRVFIRAFARPLRDPAGTISHVLIAFVDISREVKATSERDTIEQRLSFVVQHAPVVIWTAGMDGIVTLSEGAGLKALGMASGQLVGQNLFDLYRGHPDIPGNLRRGLAGEAFTYTSRAGDAFYETWLTPIRDEEGRQTGIAGLSHDVSERRRLEAEAVRNERMVALGTLAASVAHEINNPLTYVLGYLHRAREALDRGDLLRVGADIETALQGAERMAKVTRDLRTFTRPAEGPPTEVSPARVFRSVLDLVGKDLGARARSIIDLAETPPVRAEEAKLVQAVLNLVVNALQATESLPPGEACIELRTRTEGSEVVLEVADNGPGVPSEQRARVFEAFYSTKEAGKGTGLGLFVVQNIVRGAGGSVALDERPGGGARFQLRFPAATPAKTASGPASGGAVPTGASIWVIDDEKLLAEVLSSQLASAGYRVRAFSDPASALEALLGPEAADLVFCDLMMQGPTGMQIEEALERRNPGRAARMVYMSGGAFTPEGVRFQERMGDRCVNKPFDVVAEARRRLT